MTSPPLTFVGVGGCISVSVGCAADSSGDIGEAAGFSAGGVADGVVGWLAQPLMIKDKAALTQTTKNLNRAGDFISHLFGRQVTQYRHSLGRS